MKIGYSVEGSTDRALLVGLKQRWCPNVELIEGHFRGNTGLRRFRELPRICTELILKGADLIVLMRDANLENWRDALRAERQRCRSEHKHLTVFAVCDRNVESWICTDADWIAHATGNRHKPNDFRIADPKNIFASAMQITGIEKRETEIAKLILSAPLNRWLDNDSFAAFYDLLRQKSLEHGCSLENLRGGIR